MARAKPSNKSGDAPLRLKAIEAITAPLGFYVLALLIIESFLGLVLINAKLDANNTMIGIYVGISMFLLVIIAVSIIVWARPSNLTFDKDAHLVDRGRVPYGSDLARVDPATLFSGPKNEET